MTTEAAQTQTAEVAPNVKQVTPARVEGGRFAPGASGNVYGRPLKGQTLGDKLRTALSLMSDGHVNRTNSEAVIATLIASASDPNSPLSVRAAELILDRIDGKVSQPIELSQVAIVLTQDQYDAIP